MTEQVETEAEASSPHAAEIIADAKIDARDDLAPKIYYILHPLGAQCPICDTPNDDEAPKVESSQKGSRSLKAMHQQ